MPLDRAKVRKLLNEFDFKQLFIEEMGWGSVPDGRAYPIEGNGYKRRLIAEVLGVTVLEVFPSAPDGTLPDREASDRIHRQIEKLSHENVIIFLDDDRRRAKAMLYWVKREDGKRRPRRHHYFKGQPGDLFMSIIDGMVIDIDETRDDGQVPLSVVTYKLSTALDIEKVTRRFYEDFKDLRVSFVDLIQGIDKDEDRNRYASVLLNRLMFIYFLQIKGFIQSKSNYLDVKLKESQARGPDLYYSEFLKALFFEGFAMRPEQRNPRAKALLGSIPYLNGGLFLPHELEGENSQIRIPDRAFENVLSLFGRYSWYLDDRPSEVGDEINPDVLGYILEKYINDKSFGAYYTRTEITEYLCERSIHPIILQHLNAHGKGQLLSMDEVYEQMQRDADLCHTLLDFLPEIKILDPACGSGAFLVAAMKNLLRIYGKVYEKVFTLNDPELSQRLKDITDNHPSWHYYIRRKIITDNLYGVDIMDEATEIARLRLFLALVGAARKLPELEPLPNIDFNIMAGNSLIGLQEVTDRRFDEKKQLNLWPTKTYRQVVDVKNALVAQYSDEKNTEKLQQLRERIDAHRRAAQVVLNNILLDDFLELKIAYERAQLKGKAEKRQLESADIEALSPFHWDYEFSEISERGGFDVIITNPPWEVFQTDEKEFFQQFDPLIQKKKLKITDWKKQRRKLMEDPEIAQAWLEYASSFPHVSRYIKQAPQYRNQISRMNGKIVSRKINLYAVFTEQCYNLLRHGGACGIVIPSGIYSDLGTKQLRQMLFETTEVNGLFCFQNRKQIFEGVVSLWKFVVLDFRKGGITESFPAAFMRLDVSELAEFPTEDNIQIDVDLIKRSSPASLSITEFKNDLDLQIVDKMLAIPLLGEEIPDTWNVKFRQELNMTSDSDLFYEEPAPGRLPLYEGKMIWQFEHGYAPPRYWIDERDGRKRVLGKRGEDAGQTLDYQMYRLAHRSIARSTDTRTLVASVVPRTFAGNSLNVWTSIEPSQLLACVCTVNSFTIDWLLRQSVSANINMFYLYQLPIPRLRPADSFFDAIVRRARLR